MPTTMLVTTPRSVVGTAFADVTDLTASVAANKKYKFRFIVHFTTNATTTGARFSTNGPASPNAIRYGGIVPSAASAISCGSQSAYDTPIVATTAGPGAVECMGIIEGILDNGANAGTLALRFAAEVVSPGQVTVLTNSHGTIEEFT